MEENGKKDHLAFEDILKMLKERREEVAALPLKELEEYMLEKEFIAEFLWPGEKHEHPKWLLQLLEEKKQEARAQSNDTAGSLKTNGQN